MNPLISKARKPKFDLTLRIIDLNNVPLVTGTSLIKYTLPSSAAPGDHTGRTDRCPIKEHKVTYDYVRTLPIRLTIDKHNALQPCPIDFEVLQDFHTHTHAVPSKGERICLGTVSLNLAEYVEESEEGEEGVTRRYLLQDSKINSTVRIGILLRQVDGERGFVAPPLKTAAVFGGIAGIMAGEREGEESVGHLPNLNKTRDHSELHDIYRRSLAASWAAQAGELPADQCIEDIFNGGSGFKTKSPPPHPTSLSSHNPDLLHGHLPSYSHGHHSRQHSNASDKSNSTIRKPRMGHKRDVGGGNGGGLGTKGSESSLNELEGGGNGERGRSGMRRASEVDEFEFREDLVAWRLPGTVR